jgi:8-oxo-dGTP pyrophosphatase MutT (NUDIX family)
MLPIFSSLLSSEEKSVKIEHPLMDDRSILIKLKRRLNQKKPGLKAQLTMAPHPRPGQRIHTEAEETCLKAGVMLLIFPRDKEFRLVLTRRTATVLHHRDQIGFPGGQFEPGENSERAALRETLEEIGVPSQKLKIIGTLTPLYIPPSNYCIYPVVSAADESLLFRPFPDEVAEIIEVPLRHFLDPRNIRRETWTIRGEAVDVPFYAFAHHKIWGATAMVLAEFLEVLKSTL